MDQHSGVDDRLWVTIYHKPQPNRNPYATVPQPREWRADTVQCHGMVLELQGANGSMEGSNSRRHRIYLALEPGDQVHVVDRS